MWRQFLPVSCALALGFAACSSEPRRDATPALPAAYQQAGALDTDAWPTADWYRGFSSERLNTLLNSAADHNLDIAAAIERVQQADARARIAGAALLPQLNADLSSTQFDGRSNGVRAHENDWSALLSASYEIDFWGKNRALGKAAREAAAASRAQAETVRITILSSVATTYFELLELGELESLAYSNLESSAALLKMTERRFAAGMAASAEVAIQRAVVANAELKIPQIQQSAVELRGALAVLVGDMPEDFKVDTESFDSLSEPALGPGVPSQLLQHRPDISAAEHELRAAHADVLAARAAMFPSLDLGLNGGVQNPAVQAAVITLAGTGLSLTATASMAQALFDGGRRRAAIDVDAAHERELLANYRASILAGLLDVENALSVRHSLDVQQRPQREAAAQSEHALAAAQARYREGAAEFSEVLEAQTLVFGAREQWSRYRLARLQAAVSLCKALGGGWTR